MGAPFHREVFDHVGLYLYMTLGTSLIFAVFGFRVGRSEATLYEANTDLSEIAVTDGLTHLRNARFFWARIGEAWEAARRSNRALAVIILDLDHFKQVNDLHGHPVGDRVLAEVARRIADHVRGGDTAARVGGEEFAVVLPATSLTQAREVAERIRASVASQPIDGNESPITITVSAGVAVAHEFDSDEANALYRRADDALYAAKAAGRNRVATYDDAASNSSA